MSMRLFGLCVCLLLTRPLIADYIPPTFQELVEGSTAIVDATVERVDAQGHPVLKIHGYFKGSNAPDTVRGIYLACKGELPAHLLNPSQRFVLCLWKDQLFEYRTHYPVRDGLGGKPELWYQDAKSGKNETLTFPEFRRRVAEARERAVVKERVAIPGMELPLAWWADESFDPSDPSMRGLVGYKKLVRELPAPWSVPKLLELHRGTMKHAEQNPSDDYDEYLRRCRPLQMLAATQDIRAVIALGETLSSPVKHMPLTAAATLRDSFHVVPEWPKKHKTLVAAVRHWWSMHEQPLRGELDRLTKAEASKP